MHVCPKLQNRKEGKLNVAQAPGNTSRGQGISHSILDGIILFRDHPIRVLFDTGASHSFISKELVDTFSLNDFFENCESGWWIRNNQFIV